MTAGDKEARAGAPRPLQVPSGRPAPCKQGADAAEIPRGPGGPGSPDSGMSLGPGLQEQCSACPGRNTLGLGFPGRAFTSGVQLPSLMGLRAGPSPAVLSFLAPFDTSKWGASRGPAFRCAQSSRVTRAHPLGGPRAGSWSPPARGAPRCTGPAPGCASDEKEVENSFWRGHRERF